MDWSGVRPRAPPKPVFPYFPFSQGTEYVVSHIDLPSPNLTSLLPPFFPPNHLHHQDVVSRAPEIRSDVEEAISEGSIDGLLTDGVKAVVRAYSLASIYLYRSELVLSLPRFIHTSDGSIVPTSHLNPTHSQPTTSA